MGNCLIDILDVTYLVLFFIADSWIIILLSYQVYLAIVIPRKTFVGALLAMVAHWWACYFISYTTTHFLQLYMMFPYKVHLALYL